MYDIHVNGSFLHESQQSKSLMFFDYVCLIYASKMSGKRSDITIILSIALILKSIRMHIAVKK